jgi:hypothetical protein
MVSMDGRIKAARSVGGTLRAKDMWEHAQLDKRLKRDRVVAA